MTEARRLDGEIDAPAPAVRGLRGGEPLWMTVVEVSEVLDVPIHRVYELVDTGAVPARRIGRSTMIDRQDVRRMQARIERRRRAEPSAETGSL